MKRIWFGIFAGTAALWAAGGCCGLDKNRELSGRIETLEAEIAGIRAQQQVKDKIGIRDLFEIYLAGGQLDPSLVYRYLKAIALPENPTDEQVKDYLIQLGALRNYHHHNDLLNMEVAFQLRKGGPRILADIIPLMNQNPILRYAAGMLVSPKDKPLLQSYLKNPNTHYVIEIYRNLADQSDCDILLEMLPHNPALYQIIQTLALPKEKLLPVVTEMLLQERSFNYYEQLTLYVLKNLDDEARGEFIRKFWKNFTRMEKGNRPDYILLLLAPYGFIPAFEYLAEAPELFRNDPYRQKRFIAFTPCRNFSEFKKWYEKNKGREIYFDEIEGIYNFRAESSTRITNE